MGPGMDAFFASKLVQDLLVHYLAPYCRGTPSEVDYNIAKAVMEKLFTPCALAHMVHKISNWETHPFYKRPLPTPIMRMIEYRLVPRLRSQNLIGENEKYESMKAIKDQISGKMTNSRTTFVRTAVRKSPTPDFAVAAMYEVDLDFFSQNQHAMDNRIGPADMETFIALCDERGEYRDFVKEFENMKKEAQEKALQAVRTCTVNDVFKKLRGPPGRKPMSVFNVVKMVIGLGYLLNKDLEEMQYEECPEVPNLLNVHKQIMEQYKGRYHVLVQEFIGLDPEKRITVDYTLDKHPDHDLSMEVTPRRYVKSPRKLPGDYIADKKARQKHLEKLIMDKIPDEDKEQEIGSGSSPELDDDPLNQAGIDIHVSSDEASKEATPTPASNPPTASTIEQAMMAAAGPSHGPLADAQRDPSNFASQLEFDKHLEKVTREAQMLKEFDAKRKALQQLQKEVEQMKAKMSPGK